MPSDAPRTEPAAGEPEAARRRARTGGNAPEPKPPVSQRLMRETRSYKPPEPDLP